MGDYAVVQATGADKSAHKYCCLRGLYTSPFLFIMNKAKYESLSAKHKAITDKNAGMALAKLAGELWDSFEDPVGVP